ncbi:MAG: SAM-dependent methyltransferase [Gammaproteobacteria bacterium]|nr:SAM-dependent methyltransferase [Gammaproteobacteria bacterium]
MTDPSLSAREKFLAELAVALQVGECWALILSQPRQRPSGESRPPAGKISVRPVEIAGRRCYQLAERRGNQEFHRNVSADEVLHRATAEIGPGYAQADLHTRAADYCLRMNGRNGPHMSRQKSSRAAPALAHDRRKQYLIPEGEPCAFMQEIGVMTATGQVRAARQAKFRQVNRFLELVDDVLPELPPDARLRVVDFGCGKSYLTFALHHLLRNIRGREVEIVGLDLKADVIRDCRRIAERLACPGLRFEVGDIAGYVPPGGVDLVVTLHACDTASDAALAQAIRWNTKVILAAPCCQHEVAGLLSADLLPGLLRFGILKERFAAMATDALRAAILERAGYQTQIVEFIDLEHTPKNLLLRAIRRAQPESAAAEAVEVLKRQLGIRESSLERLLQDVPG